MPGPTLPPFTVASQFGKRDIFSKFSRDIVTKFGGTWGVAGQSGRTLSERCHQLWW